MVIQMLNSCFQKIMEPKAEKGDARPYVSSRRYSEEKGLGDQTSHPEAEPQESCSTQAFHRTHLAGVASCTAGPRLQALPGPSPQQLVHDGGQPSSRSKLELGLHSEV